MLPALCGCSQWQFLTTFRPDNGAKCSQRIMKVITANHDADINVCAKVNDNPSRICWDASLTKINGGARTHYHRGTSEHGLCRIGINVVETSKSTQTFCIFMTSCQNPYASAQMTQPSLPCQRQTRMTTGLQLKQKPIFLHSNAQDLVSYFRLNAHTHTKQ